MSLRRALAGVLAALVALALLLPALVAGAEEPEGGEVGGAGLPSTTTSTDGTDLAVDDGPEGSGGDIETPGPRARAALTTVDDGAPSTGPTADGSATTATPTVVGDGCLPGAGVTVVVDFTALLDEVHVGCAPGEQASGLSAMAAAGFTTTDESGAGTVCTIDGRPSEGYPHCWLTGGYWSYWTTGDAGGWAFSEVGAGAGPLAPGSVEGWSWAPSFDGAEPRIAPDAIPVPDPECSAAPEAPVLSIIDDDEVLPFTLEGAGQVEIAVLEDGADPVSAEFAVVDELPLSPYEGEIRVLARVAGCDGPSTFDATYDVRDTYAPRWSAGTDTNPSPAVDKGSDRIAGWATGHSEYVPGPGVSDTFKVPENAYGPVDSSLVVLGDRGRITLTFDRPITDGPGDDLAVFENGFGVGSGPLDFLELGYVEVSSNGTDFVRFDSASRRASTVGSFSGQLATELGGLAGKDLAGRGTPFDLQVLRNTPEVRSGSVDLDVITHVRVVDVTGDGADLDSFGRPVYDAYPTTGSAGFDLTGVAVLNELPPDTTAPVVTITGGPDDPSPSTSATIAFTVDEVVTAECRLDGGGWAPCTSPFEVADLEEGDHSVEVRATDLAENVGRASWSWTVALPIVDPPDEPWVDERAAAALDWLITQLEANEWTLPGFAPGTPDWGLTADAVLALTVAGRDDWYATQQATARLAGGVAQYATWDDLGPEYAGVRVAGAFAKLLVVAGATGADPGDFGGWDLELEVRALMRTSGDQEGRFSDLEPHFGTDASNGFGQALAMIGLAGTEEGVPEEATEFLLAQQCPGGGFRLVYATTPGCVDAAEADTDTTALAMQALLGVERTGTVDEALSHALRWLLDRQDASTGGWGGTGPTAAVNANSSALIGQLVGAVGQEGAASDAAAYVRSLQLGRIAGTAPSAVVEDSGPFTEGDEGAIAYDSGAFAAVVDGTIAGSALDQWRRATAQAVLALDLPLYLQAVADVEILPVDPDGPVPPTTTTTAPPSTTTTVMPTTTAPDGSTTSVHDDSTTTVAGGLGGDGDVGAGGLGAAPAVTPTGALPYTGGDVARLVVVAAVLLGLGLLARSAARRRG